MNQNLSVAILTIALLAVATSTAVVMAEETQDQPQTLIGQLSRNADSGQYSLIEQESGDEVRLRGPDSLASHIGEAVKVTGKWAKDQDGDYFEVVMVEKAEKAEKVE